MSTSLHVAGIGASAGGLEAMLPMFARMQATGRIAFVVAQHMAKDGHDELVVRLIGRESALPVVLALHGVRLQADTVYVIPSGKDGRVNGDTLSLSEPAAEHLSTPSVNALFVSIAESGKARAIGILLSGTGSDGAIGCRAIKAGGGLTLAQDPLEAKFNGMPVAAITAKTIDKVLSVERIGATLAELFPGAAMPPSVSTVSAVSEEDAVSAAAQRELDTLLRQVHQATSIDFSSYKEETLLRRLEKRKSTLGIGSPDAYQALIRRQPEELHVLQHLFLVSVSSFFRDRESFVALKMSLAKIVSGKPATEPVRVWVAGCASGEEPYTLAILLRELTDKHRIEIIATDLNPEALAMCREGVYRLTAFKEMDADLRDRYFLPKGQHFEIKPEIKACVRFEQRDVLGGAPPDNLDLVSCRNLLIYMKSKLQDKLIKSFHQALRSQGLLFIGQSESLSFVGNSLFAPIDHYHRLFRRRH
jgi:chemotaxis protein methyltransferase CheR/two-component system CheB/CheR fusion protein